MELVHQMRKSIPTGQQTNCFCKGIALWSNTTNQVGSWRFSVWRRCGDTAQNAWWNRKSYSLCLTAQTKSKKNYIQLEKEALTLVYKLKKFHGYLYGQKFTLLTDHQPLTNIFHPNKGIPSLAAARLLSALSQLGLWVTKIILGMEFEISGTRLDHRTDHSTNQTIRRSDIPIP